MRSADPPTPAAPVRLRDWRPAFAYRLSAGVHAVALAGAVAQPSAWPWAAAAIGGNHALLALAGLLPRSRAFGANLSRLPARAASGRIALTFDDGPDPAVTPAVLDRLDRAGLRATFFCVGERVARHAALACEIVRRGHAIENHSQHHPAAFGWYGWRRLCAEVDLAQRAIADATGQAPAFFRAPFGIRNPLVEPVLATRGLRYASWTRRGYDTVERDASRIAGRLLRGLRAGDVLLLHDGVATGRRDDPAAMLEALDRVVDATARAGLTSVTLRAACAEAEAPRAAGRSVTASRVEH